MFQNKSIIVTGANGLLGHEVISNLKENNQVIALVRSVPKEKHEGVEYISVDLSTDWNIDLLPQKISAVLHLAQSPHFREFPNMALDVFNVNVASTAKLLDYSKSASVEHFIYTSSGGVYGSGSTVFSENAAIVNHGKLGYYLGSKLCSEVLVQNYASLMDVSVLRVFFMYGARQKRSMLIPRLVDNILNGKAINLQQHDGIKINPLHVSDAAAALEKLIAIKGSYTLNVAGSEIVSLRELAEIIGKVVGKKPVFDVSNDEPKHLVADIKQLADIGVVPKKKLLEGISELVKGL